MLSNANKRPALDDLTNMEDGPGGNVNTFGNYRRLMRNLLLELYTAVEESSLKIADAEHRTFIPVLQCITVTAEHHDI